MPGWNALFPRWWHQWQLEVASLALSRHGLWGFHEACLDGLYEAIEPRLAARYPAQRLKQTQASLHAVSIDHLTSDLYLTRDTILHRQYVDERLAYVTLQPTDLYRYLTHRDGYALPVRPTFRIFHQEALQTAQAVDVLVDSDESEIDRAYYLRRYQGIFHEAFVVYGLFASLAGLTLPSPPTASA